MPEIRKWYGLNRQGLAASLVPRSASHNGPLSAFMTPEELVLRTNLAPECSCR